VKNIIDVQREKENQAASEARREEYALTRDQQAMEQNEVIARRIILNVRNIDIVKCDRCGKEFHAGNVSDQKTCPDCRKG
jgi:formylmethanofuran dehydrogenase subunit E